MPTFSKVNTKVFNYLWLKYIKFNQFGISCHAMIKQAMKNSKFFCTVYFKELTKSEEVVF